MSEKTFKVIITVVVPVVIVLYLLLFHTNLIIISNPDSNIYIENLNWTEVTRINETTYWVMLSGDITYRYKESSQYYSSKDEPLPDDLPVRILVLAGVPNSRDREVTFSENITLQYRQPYHFEYTFDLKAGKSYSILVEAQWKKYFATPHPYYGEWRWDRFGGGATEIDLIQAEHHPPEGCSGTRFVLNATLPAISGSYLVYRTITPEDTMDYVKNIGSRFGLTVKVRLLTHNRS